MGLSSITAAVFTACSKRCYLFLLFIGSSACEPEKELALAGCNRTIVPAAGTISVPSGCRYGRPSLFRCAAFRGLINMNKQLIPSRLAQRACDARAPRRNKNQHAPSAAVISFSENDSMVRFCSRMSCGSSKLCRTESECSKASRQDCCFCCCTDNSAQTFVCFVRILHAQHSVHSVHKYTSIIPVRFCVCVYVSTIEHRKYLPNVMLENFVFIFERKPVLPAALAHPANAPPLFVFVV